MTRKRLVRVLLGLTAVLVLLALGAVLVLQSSWFYNKVRQGIVTEVEKATGGRAELGSFRFDWQRLRAEAGGLTLHGKEPADKPPLLHAASVAVGLKIISLMKRDVDVQYLEVTGPQVYLIVNPDGSTNLPEPKRPHDPQSRPLDPLFQLAAGRFALRNGVFEIENRGKTPFQAQGRNLELALLLAGLPGGEPEYRGTISMRPLEIQAPGIAKTGLDVAMAVTLGRNRVGITTGNISTGGSTVELSGEIGDLQSPHGTFRYHARAAVADAARIFDVKQLGRGTVQSQGTVNWQGGSAYSVSGDWHAEGMDYRSSGVQIRLARADGTLALTPQEIALNGMRFSTSAGGTGACKGAVWPCPIQLSGTIASSAIRGQEVDLRGIAVAVLGGEFRGQAHVTGLDRFTSSGEVSGIEARRAVAVYSAASLPWDGLVSGKVQAEGSLKRSSDLRAQVEVNLSPASEGTAVHGQLAAIYDARGNHIEVSRGTLALPSTHAELSGVVGSRLMVHADSRDLNDILPVLGKNASDLPVKLQNGSAVFDGTVSGSLDHPQVSGHVRATNASYSGKLIDSLEADADAVEDNLRLRNVAVSHAGVKAQGQLAVALHEWKPEDSSLIDGSVSVRGAGVQELAALANTGNVPVSGTVSTTAQVNGTIADPLVNADVEVTKGELRGEPFDRFTGHIRYTARQIELTGGQATAGAKAMQVSATFDHAPEVFDTGRVQFKLSSNALPMEQIQTLRAEYPDVKGTIQFTSAGTLSLAPAKNGELGFRIAALQADVAGQGLQLSEQALGDLHLTANTEGQELRAHLQSAVANSVITGDGSWRLEGDYSGSALVKFSRVDFGALRAWLQPSQAGVALPITGFAEGQVQVQGSLLKPQESRAELRIPTLEIAGVPPSGPRPAASPATLTLRNSGPLVATLANSVVTVNSAHLVGRSTDLTVTGKASLQDKNPLDLRVNGTVDLGIVHDFNRDFQSSGTISADAAVRGTFGDPQISGRVAFQNATFQVSDLPNGISAANGVILFTGDRATIQNFSGETGGGKIRLTGFAAYGGGPLAYRLHAVVSEVRIRYPEGVSTVANANLNFTGTSDRSMLAGTVTVLRTGFNPQSDFSSLIAASSQPVRTPSAQSGILGGMNFDIQIQTAPDIQVQSTLTQDIGVEANLRLRGTFSNPAVLGRVNITQGQVVFFGTKYNISQGSIAFYNPVRIEPVLDIDLETKARGIDVTLTVSGPLGKLNLTPRSDPPLQFNEIVALLATGRAPTNDPTMLAQQATSPSSWQQMGASALLGQAIASRVTGRLQRFFGVSRLRIDPTLPGIEYNPQARLTLEQQVTSEITFTYITNVTNSNPQVVQVEWAFAKQWSVVALREENGMFGIDFYFKKRF